MSAPRSSRVHREIPRTGLVLAASLLAPLALAAPAPDLQGDLTQLSFEELANLKVTSVSRRSEPLADAAASVYVITAEQIRRSGATTLPEVLRLAPNLHVAAASASGYAISARGMNGSTSVAPNKLLVMIDGRSVYTPLFSGVFWDAQEVMVEDIERVEVVSGPGGTLWGVNAVNGVINVTTRSAADSGGGLVSVGSGNHESRAALRYGGHVGDDGHFRVHASARRHDNTRTETGLAIDDAGRMAQAGFRIDQPGWGGELTLFNIDFDKELLLTRVGVDGIWTDLGATRHRGIESSMRYDLGQWNAALKGLTAGVSYTYTEAVSRAGDFAGRDLPLYSRHTGQLWARYALGQWTLNADLAAQSKQRSPGSGTQYVTQEDAAGRLGDIPGFATVGLRAGYDFGKSLSNLRVAVGVKNLFDRRYYTRSTDNNGGKYVGMPRTLYVQGTLPF